MAELTPAAWLDVLDRRLTARNAKLQILQDGFDGKRPMAFATSSYRKEFGRLLQGMSDNWCRIVVSSSVERLEVQGFRFGAEQQADTDAWAIWQANGLDATSNLAHTEAVKLGEAYWLVEPPAPRSSDPPRITAEHPSQMIVATAPGDRRRRLAALKRWLDEDDGYVYATLYLPRALHKWRSQEKVRGDRLTKINWRRRDDDAGGVNTLGVVPAIPILNAPSLLGAGTSDLETALPIQDAIDKLVMDLIVTSEFAAFRQRVMTGVEIARYPDNHPEVEKRGKPIPIEGGVARLMTVEKPDARVYDLPASDLKNYVQAIEMFVQHLAAQTKTPPHYLLGNIVNASGDALKAAEAGLVSKVRDKMLSFGDAHEDAMRLAFRALGDDRRASATEAETLWSDPETRSFAQTVDGAVKLKELNVPDEMLWAEIGKSPQWIARAKAMQAANGLFEDGQRTDAAPNRGAQAVSPGEAA